MSNNDSKFSWTKLYIFKKLTDKPSNNSVGAIIIPVLIVGIVILGLPWWLCVIIILAGVFSLGISSK